MFVCRIFKENINKTLVFVKMYLQREQQNLKIIDFCESNNIISL